MARSVISHQAQFLDSIATLASAGQPSASPRAFRKAAMRRTWSPTWAQVKSFTSVPPMGWVRAMRLAAVRSQ